MNDNIFYSDIIISKSGIEIPLFNTGKTVDSRYDPVKESLRLSQEIDEKTNFVIVLGIASGILIKTILEKRANIFILALEAEQKDIDFLLRLQTVKELSLNKRICFCTTKELFQKITQLYIPAFYNNLKVIEQRGWTAEHNSLLPQINQEIQKAVGIVSADFSVQSHFGKLWQHNIITNISVIEKTKELNYQSLPIKSKKALVLAAGPTIDKTINQIKNNLNEYFIIATDTAFSILLSYNIIPQLVISLDGQNISTSHFIHTQQFDFSNTIFLFDLCANASAVKKIINEKHHVSFFVSGHPLSDYIKQRFKLKIPKLYSGAGTVTIAALDFAIKCGFTKIIVAGADFGYSNGKPYAKGTYLDRLYNKSSQRLNSNQKQFSTLMYRTPLIKKNQNSSTSQILQAYQTSFEDYLVEQDLTFVKEDQVYKISNQKSQISFYNKEALSQNLNGNKIIQELYKDILSVDSNREINTIFDLTKTDICLLPLISWQKNNDNIDKTDFMYFYRKVLGGIKK